MIRVVADTNVFISALMFDGLPGVFLDLARLHTFTLVTSHSMLDELDEKFRLKFGMPEEDAIAVRRKLESMSMVVVPRMELDAVPDDPDDNRVLDAQWQERLTTW